VSYLCFFIIDFLLFQGIKYHKYIPINLISFSNIYLKTSFSDEKGLAKFRKLKFFKKKSE